MILRADARQPRPRGRILPATALLGHLVGGLASAALAGRRQGPAWAATAAGQARCQAWMARASDLLGLAVETRGRLLPGPGLLVANHISWTDIPGLGSLAGLRFVAKEEIRRWPLLGSLAARSGTLFAARQSPRRMRQTLEAVRATLEGGSRVVVFPEGTTGTGPLPGPFRPWMFQAAVDAGCPVQPVALRYRHRQGTAHVPFVGDQTLVDHLWAWLGRPGTRLRIDLLEPLPGTGSHRRQLARESRNAIVRSLEGP